MLFTLAMLGRIICIDMTNLFEHEIAWEFHMFHLPMELPTLYHQLGARVCNGLTPFNGYALRTFSLGKRE